MQAIKGLMVLLLFLFSGLGCTDDKLSKEMGPRITRAMNGVAIDYAKESIPSGLLAEFTVYGLFNDTSREVLSAEELRAKVVWDSESDDGVVLHSDPVFPERLRFSGTGSVLLTVHYTDNGTLFSASNRYEITVPALSALSVEEELNSADLSSCCSQAAIMEGTLMLGCVRRFQTIGTYDNGAVEVQPSDAVSWSIISNGGQLVESAVNLEAFPATRACIESVDQAGLVIASAIGNFRVKAEHLGIEGVSSSTSVIAPTLTAIEFGLRPEQMFEDNEAVFTVIGTYNNDTTADVSDLVSWSSSDESCAVFLPDKAGGTLTSKKPAVDLEVEASHLTGGSISTSITILQKQLVAIEVEEAATGETEELTLNWNQQRQLALRGYYDNGNDELLSGHVTWLIDDPAVIKINQEGLVTAQQPPQNKAIAYATAVYQGSMTDSIQLTVSNEAGEIKTIVAVPGSITLIEGGSAAVSLKAVYSNLSQENLHPHNPNLDISYDEQLLLVTADAMTATFIVSPRDVDSNHVPVPVNFTYDDGGTGISTHTSVSILDTQLTGITISKSADEVIEGTPVLLTATGIFSGYEEGVRELEDGEVSWHCLTSVETDCSEHLTGSTFQVDKIDATSQTFHIGATSTAALVNQIEPVTAAASTVTVFQVPAVNFELEYQEVNEDAPPLLVAVRSTTKALSEIIIPFNISGVATIYDDFTLDTDPHQIIIAPGSTIGSTTLTLVNDSIAEPEETLLLTLADHPVNARRGERYTHLIRILDDDQPTVFFTNASQSKSEASGVLSANIALDLPNDRESVTVRYSIVTGFECAGGAREAIFGKDYGGIDSSGDITFSPGTVSQTLSLAVYDDAFHETAECLLISLSDPNHAVLGDNSPTRPTIQQITLIDNDPLVFLNDPPTEITNTGEYSYRAETTPFDGSSDQRLFKSYHLPTWADVTMDAGVPLLFGTPSRLDVGVAETSTILCVSDSDNGTDYSLAPGAQTACKPFNINVTSCRLVGPSGNINTGGDFQDTINCGKPVNHVTIGDGSGAEELTIGEDDLFSGILVIGSNGTFSLSDVGLDGKSLEAELRLKGGRLNVDVNHTLAGTVSVIGSGSRIAINSEKSVVYTGDEILLQDHGFTLLGGAFINQAASALCLNHPDSVLLLTGIASQDPGFVGHVSIQSSSLNHQIRVTHDYTIDTLHLSADASIHIEEEKTLRMNNPLLTDSNVEFSGSGSLMLAGGLMSGNGLITVTNAEAALDGDMTITAAMDGNSLTDWLLNGYELNWDTPSSLVGKNVTLGDGGKLIIGKSIVLNASLDLSGGGLKVVEDLYLVNGVKALTGDAAIDVDNDRRMVSTGATLDIGPTVLDLAGSGIVDNSSDLVLNHSDSVLHLTGENGMLNKARFSVDSAPGKGIIADADYVIHTLTLDSSRGLVFTADDKTLLIGSRLYVKGAGSGLTNTSPDSGAIVLHDIVLEGDLELSDKITLAADATLYVLTDATLTVHSDLIFNDGLVVADGAKLTIAGGDYTVTFAGGYTLGSTGEVVVSGDITLKLTSVPVDDEDWDRTSTKESGQTSPSGDGALDVLSFRATSGDGSIVLDWSYQAGSYNRVLIRRKSGGFPSSTVDGDLVYDGSADSCLDDVGNGVQNRILTYYTAFAHNGLGSHAPGVGAMAAATNLPEGLISYYMLGAEDCVDGFLLDSCGLENHGRCLSTPEAIADVHSGLDLALHFNGSDAIEIDNPLLEPIAYTVDTLTEDFSISFWIKTVQTGGDAGSDWFHEENSPIIDGKIGIDQNDFGIALAEGRILFGTETNGYAFTLASTASDPVNDDTWHHITVTRAYASGDMEIYLDGELNSSGSGSVCGDLSSASFLVIGRSPFGSTYFEGGLDEIRFYRNVLTAIEVQSLFNH